MFLFFLNYHGHEKIQEGAALPDSLDSEEADHASTHIFQFPRDLADGFGRHIPPDDPAQLTAF